MLSSIVCDWCGDGDDCVAGGESTSAILALLYKSVLRSTRLLLFLCAYADDVDPTVARK